MSVNPWWIVVGLALIGYLGGGLVVWLGYRESKPPALEPTVGHITLDELARELTGLEIPVGWDGADVVETLMEIAAL